MSTFDRFVISYALHGDLRHRRRCCSLLKEIIREIGLDPAKFTERLGESNENGDFAPG